MNEERIVRRLERLSVELPTSLTLYTFLVAVEIVHALVENG